MYINYSQKYQLCTEFIKYIGVFRAKLGGLNSRQKN